MSREISSTPTTSTLLRGHLHPGPGDVERQHETGASAAAEVVGGDLPGTEAMLQVGGGVRGVHLGGVGGHDDLVDVVGRRDRRRRVAFSAAWAARSRVVSSSAAKRRSWIPVRVTIHSSSVSISADQSALVITRDGTYEPNPRIPMRSATIPLPSRISGYAAYRSDRTGPRPGYRRVSTSGTVEDGKRRTREHSPDCPTVSSKAPDGSVSRLARSSSCCASATCRSPACASSRSCAAGSVWPRCSGFFESLFWVSAAADRVLQRHRRSGPDHHVRRRVRHRHAHRRLRRALAGDGDRPDPGDRPDRLAPGGRGAARRRLPGDRPQRRGTRRRGAAQLHGAPPAPGQGSAGDRGTRSTPRPSSPSRTSASPRSNGPSAPAPCASSTRRGGRVPPTPSQYQARIRRRTERPSPRPDRCHRSPSSRSPTPRSRNPRSGSAVPLRDRVR